MTWMSEADQVATLDPLATVLYEAADLTGNPEPFATIPSGAKAMYRRMAYAAHRAAEREELARGSHLTPTQIAAMDDATVARLVALMRDRADVARDYTEER